MEKLEYFSKVIKVVTELIEVTDAEILGKSRKAEVVDARWLVVVLMRDKGYTTRQISHLICHPERTVNHVINNIDERIKYSYNGLGNILAISRQLLKE